MTTKTDGGPAYPARVSVKRDTGELQPYQFGNDDFCTEGMTLRQYAAIHLGVPDSGTDWLDDMIRERMRDEVAAKVLQGILAGATSWSNDFSVRQRSRWSYAQADAALAQREDKS